jgi:Tol biopolymer transport system component
MRGHILPDIDGVTTRVSVSSTGTQTDEFSWRHSISADGRYVAFASGATNLVSGDTNGTWDVFVHDRVTGETARVSVSSIGTQADGWSSHTSISADGRYVAFASAATNLVAGDTNGVEDIFVHNRVTGETARVSVSSTGAQANGSSGPPSISADGRYVAFVSAATNLVSGDTNGVEDIFVHDRVTGETARVSVSSTGAQANDISNGSSISADGRYVAFASAATNLVAGDTNGVEDIFVYDRETGETARVSVSSTGAQANDSSDGSSISADGRYVAFSSLATNLVTGDTNGIRNVFLHDRETGETTRVSVSSAGVQANGHSYSFSTSADGRYVAFESVATNLVPGDNNGMSDVFVRDRVTGQTARVSITRGSRRQGDDWSWSGDPSISTDGRYVAFASFASDLVPGDTNGILDVFVRDRGR